MEFQTFGKIERYEKAHVTITEKIDGTNACIAIDEDGNMTLQSRNRIITVDDDNYGFAQWATKANTDGALASFFGPGRHYGEWWGVGIQRGYGTAARYFSPFNTGLFNQDRDDYPEHVTPLPVMWKGMLTTLNAGVDSVMEALATNGSHTLPGVGWAAEGCMIWSRPTGYLKVPFDLSHKWEQIEQQVAA